MRWPRAAAIAATIAVAGCVGATVSVEGWVRPDVEHAELVHDQYECQRLATRAAPARAERQSQFDDCMRARGYRRQP